MLSRRCVMAEPAPSAGEQPPPDEREPGGETRALEGPHKGPPSAPDWGELLSSRWQAGDAARVEAFLAEHPAAAGGPGAVRKLVLLEVLLRRERGEVVSLREYLQRFPDLELELRQHFHLLE